jgi:G6PDH family F420-dependent oxidoreductase
MRVGLFLSSEEYGPKTLIAQARLAEEHGFSSLWISDHFHPWNDAQGQSSLVWSTIGAISQVSSLPITTAVTCPTTRIHPAIVAQAAATSAVLTDGRFILGVGSGEAVNEHITGARWPSTEVRLEMLEEAVEVIRKLWTGDVIDHHGRFYTVEHARIYTLPAAPPLLYVSGFGPRSTALAARIGDGFMSTKLDGDAVSHFRKSGGDSKTVSGGAKGCFAPTVDEARSIAYRLWPTEALPGEMTQVLPTPAHFEQVSALVTPDQMTVVPHGPDPEPYVKAYRAFRDAGFDELHIAPIGPHYREFIEFMSAKVIPHVR